MSILEQLNDKFEKQYSRNENKDIIDEYKNGNPLDGMNVSIGEDSPIYVDQMRKARWLADHPAKMGYRKRFISCWISFLSVAFVFALIFNSPLVLGVIGLFLTTPFIIGIFNKRGHIIDRILNALGAVLCGYIAVAGFVNTNKPFDVFGNTIDSLKGSFGHIFGSPYEFFMFSFLLIAVMIFAVKLVYPIINRMYCNVPVSAVIVSYDKARHYGTYKYSPVYQYVYQDKKYLKISPSYAYREEGELGACGEILIDPSQPKDAILPEETSKDEYIIGAVLFGIFAVMLLIYLLTML